MTTEEAKAKKKALEEEIRDKQLRDELCKQGREDHYWMALDEVGKYPQKDISIQIHMSVGIVSPSQERQLITEKSVVILRFKRKIRKVQLYAVESAGRFQDGAVLPEMKKIASEVLHSKFPEIY